MTDSEHTSADPTTEPPGAAAVEDDAVDHLQAPEPPPRPEHIPAKFWDAEQGSVRTEALARSYVELERRLSRGMALPETLEDDATRQRILTVLGRPESPDGYAIEAPSELLAPDAELNVRLHCAGFTNAQAQLVYDLAAEHLLPIQESARAQLVAQEQHDRLCQHFGGEEAWHETARQIKAWGQINLEPHVLEALSNSPKGVIAMHGMMQASEPRLTQNGDHRSAVPDEAALHEMMRDPRYWRERDPQFIARVTEGFKKLYAG